MIPQKYASLLFAFLMAFFMSLWMSLVLTLFNVGLGHSFIGIWLRGWLLAFVVAFPTTLLLAPIVRRVVSYVTFDQR